MGDPLSPNFAGLRHHGNVIIRSDEPAFGVQAEARSELAFHPDAQELQLGDRNDGLIEIHGVVTILQRRR